MQQLGLLIRCYLYTYLPMNIMLILNLYIYELYLDVIYII